MAVDESDTAVRRYLSGRNRPTSHPAQFPLDEHKYSISNLANNLTAFLSLLTHAIASTSAALHATRGNEHQESAASPTSTTSTKGTVSRARTRTRRGVPYRFAIDAPAAPAGLAARFANPSPAGFGCVTSRHPRIMGMVATEGRGRGAAATEQGAGAHRVHVKMRNFAFVDKRANISDVKRGYHRRYSLFQRSHQPYQTTRFHDTRLRNDGRFVER